ncbi:MAG: pyrimidine 5'-nucleotidase [Rhodospirillaceae bacterium]
MQIPKRSELAHIDAWVFDLDNTLYPATTNLFAQIDVRMKTFIAKALNITPDEAFKLQKQYYHRYGTSLRGLTLHHDVDPDAFLDYVHDIDHSVLNADPRLEALLAALPGRKLIYTNGSAYHAESVVKRLGVAHHFADIFDIRASAYIPKPDPAAYAAMIAKHAVTPAKAVMFEDSHKNLAPAAALGMKTVWVKHEGLPSYEGEDLSHCHYMTDDLLGWLQAIAEDAEP